MPTPNQEVTPTGGNTGGPKDAVSDAYEQIMQAREKTPEEDPPAPAPAEAEPEALGDAEETEEPGGDGEDTELDAAEREPKSRDQRKKKTQKARFEEVTRERDTLHTQATEALDLLDKQSTRLSLLERKLKMAETQLGEYGVDDPYDETQLRVAELELAEESRGRQAELASRARGAQRAKQLFEEIKEESANAGVDPREVARRFAGARGAIDIAEAIALEARKNAPAKTAAEKQAEVNAAAEAAKPLPAPTSAPTQAQKLVAPDPSKNPEDFLGAMYDQLRAAKGK